MYAMERNFLCKLKDWLVIKTSPAGNDINVDGRGESWMQGPDLPTRREAHPAAFSSKVKNLPQMRKEIPRSSLLGNAWQTPEVFQEHGKRGINKMS